jgi:heptosyltransferase-3
MKLLVISLAGIGDTLFATPLIHELRANFPDAVIDALVLWPGSRDVLEGNPHVNTVYQKNLLTVSWVEALSFLWGLRANRYDVSLNTHPQSRRHYRWAARIVGAATRISHDYDHAGLLDRWLVNRMLPQDYSRHSIENNLALLGLLEVKPRLPRHEYEIFLSQNEENWAADFVAKQNLRGQRLLGVHVGSGGTKNLALRRWPLEHYVELFRKLNRERPDVSVLLLGGPEERAAHGLILREARSSQVLQPATHSLRQAGALLKRCAAFLSVDTSLMHMAAAVAVPMQIVIETPTFNKTIEPFGRAYRLVTNPTVAGRNLDYYRYDGGGIRGTRKEIVRCMASVSVDAVYRVLESALPPVAATAQEKHKNSPFGA